jgi:hypothetical protein
MQSETDDLFYNSKKFFWFCPKEVAVIQNILRCFVHVHVHVHFKVLIYALLFFMLTLLFEGVRQKEWDGRKRQGRYDAGKSQRDRDRIETQGTGRERDTDRGEETEVKRKTEEGTQGERLVEHTCSGWWISFKHNLLYSKTDGK